VAVVDAAAPVVGVDAVVLAVELELELEPHPAAASATPTSAIGAMFLAVVFMAP
jgi:hypothetical protein